MAIEQERRDVEFKTFDGLTLRGWLFVGPKGGPAIIINAAVIQPYMNASSKFRTFTYPMSLSATVLEPQRIFRGQNSVLVWS